MRRHVTPRLAARATARHMRYMATGNGTGPWSVIACLLAITGLPAGGAQAGQDAVPGTELERLIEQFDGNAPPVDGSVHLDAWIEAGTERDQVVVVVEPRGKFKLVADPGITVTPTAQPGVEWLVPLPHRHVDPEIQYFTPPATVRLPFRADGEVPLEILVEYAYCVVDFQCFLGEEVLRVAAR
jgi:hypothetical protein